jgi:hypothetical protein
MANPTMTLIASHTTGSGGESSYTFSSIPNTYTDLKLVMSARSNLAQSSGGYTANIYPNGSSSSITVVAIRGSGSAAISFSGAYPNVAYQDASSDTANTFGNTEIYFPNYTSSNYKSYSVDGVEENNATSAFMSLQAGLWSSTSAITSLQIASNGSNFVQYSTFYLYGISNS